MKKEKYVQSKDKPSSSMMKKHKTYTYNNEPDLPPMPVIDLEIEDFEIEEVKDNFVSYFPAEDQVKKLSMSAPKALRKKYNNIKKLETCKPNQRPRVSMSMDHKFGKAIQVTQVRNCLKNLI